MLDASRFIITRWALPAVLAALAVPASAATLVAGYDFNGTLAANEAGAPALVSIDPLHQNFFDTAIVNGASKSVFGWSGTGDSSSNNAGLLLDATGLVTYNNYSVALTFEFSSAAQFGGGWRRILDLQNRQSDSGFYVNPGNSLEVVEIPQETFGTGLFTTPGFHQVVVSVSPDGSHQQVKAYLDGKLEVTAQTDFFSLDNANNPGHLLHLFVDNTSGGAQQEYANGRIASLRLYDGAYVPSPVPEPGTYAMVLAGLGLVAGWQRRIRRMR